MIARFAAPREVAAPRERIPNTGKPPRRKRETASEPRPRDERSGSRARRSRVERGDPASRDAVRGGGDPCPEEPPRVARSTLYMYPAWDDPRTASRDLAPGGGEPRSGKLTAARPGPGHMFRKNCRAGRRGTALREAAAPSEGLRHERGLSARIVSRETFPARLPLANLPTCPLAVLPAYHREIGFIYPQEGGSPGPAFGL